MSSNNDIIEPDSQMVRLLDAESVASSSGDLVEELKTACAADQLSRVQQLLKQWQSLPNPSPPRPPSRPTVHLRSALHAAVRQNRSSIVSFLLDEGFMVDFDAVSIAIKEKLIEILQVFLDHGWNINKIQGASMAPALSRVLEDEELVKWFLAHGANPNRAPSGWPSPMEKAANTASLSVIKMLVQHGGEIRSSNVVPSTAKGSKPGRLEVLEYFLDQGATVDDVEYQHDVSIFKKYWRRSFGTALHHAARRGNEEMVKFLLERGANQEIKNSMNKTALELAEEGGYENIVSILRHHESSSSH